MKAKTLYTHTLIRAAVKEEVAKHKFCFVTWYPSEECNIKEVMDIANLTNPPEDDQIIVIPAKDLAEMKKIWENVLKHNMGPKFEAYKSGKQFTF